MSKEKVRIWSANQKNRRCAKDDNECARCT